MPRPRSPPVTVTGPGLGRVPNGSPRPKAPQEEQCPTKHVPIPAHLPVHPVDRRLGQLLQDGPFLQFPTLGSEWLTQESPPAH